MTEIAIRWRALRLYDRLCLLFLAVLVGMFGLLVLSIRSGLDLSGTKGYFTCLMLAAGAAAALHRRETGRVLSGGPAWLLSLALCLVAALAHLVLNLWIVIADPRMAGGIGDIEFGQSFLLAQVPVLLSIRLAVFVGTQIGPN
ncbi:hypothetical protein [Ovoidimarina sediminis]|uniref:hypothetical protein n=1 Tax=Ovoidimarina sediminis TaxID=3079856 RepID=UPI00290C9F3F|nr:hypothetical protein [Rhodophyticola sp. MJ-SS7]MDU8946105.1 hypothetical protein [Rhodophyticola sp. MJ-SS7]